MPATGSTLSERGRRRGDGEARRGEARRRFVGVHFFLLVCRCVCLLGARGARRKGGEERRRAGRVGLFHVAENRPPSFPVDADGKGERGSGRGGGGGGRERRVVSVGFTECAGLLPTNTPTLARPPRRAPGTHASHGKKDNNPHNSAQRRPRRPRRSRRRPQHRHRRRGTRGPVHPRDALRCLRTIRPLHSTHRTRSSSGHGDEGRAGCRLRRPHRLPLGATTRVHPHSNRAVRGRPRRSVHAANRQRLRHVRSHDRDRRVPRERTLHCPGHDLPRTRERVLDRPRPQLLLRHGDRVLPRLQHRPVWHRAFHRGGCRTRRQRRRR